MFRFDYHMHTDFSLDCVEPMEQVIQQALRLGLDEIALTDHIDFRKDGTLISGNYPYDQYVAKVQKYQLEYADQLSILFGVEVGVSPQLADAVHEFLSAYAFDFIIASSHDSYGLEYYYNEFFIHKRKEDAFREYFEHCYENVKRFDTFSVYGHYDYIRRYGGYADNSLAYEDYQDIIDLTLKEAIARGKGFEVNTSGFRYGLNQVHPQLEILKRYRALGGEILTIGSDAHRKEDIAADFDIALAIIKEAGFRYLTRFKNQQPTFVAID